MNKNQDSQTSIRNSQSLPLLQPKPAARAIGQVNLSPRTIELTREVAKAYLAAQGWSQEQLKLDEYQQLLDRVVLDIAGCALLDGLTSLYGRNTAVSHWAWFQDPVEAGAFCSVLMSCGYQVLDVLPFRSDGQSLVHFTHVGPLVFDKLCNRTIFLTRQALSSGGFYDGWVVQDDAASHSACEHGLHQLAVR